ncbi:L-rhamnose mutarotase [Tatumella ptyseos]|uniref:L-rhamnose mutarotase n=1 Tax=Tatumella ptyseos TaxID=82987 RepID=UPI0026F068A2|nr:L-rhamnose mutarotase [Tatumella ptyseos]WKX27801.1 L-rhamnose mutarotase [Tatumella ptyseos]
MLRKAFVMQIKPNCHEEYQRRHSPIWPELAAILKQQGVHHYSIWLDATRNLLFAHLDVESENQWQAIAETDICKRWWLTMAPLMFTHPDNSPLSTNLTSVFYLD